MRFRTFSHFRKVPFPFPLYLRYSNLHKRHSMNLPKSNLLHCTAQGQILTVQFFNAHLQPSSPHCLRLLRRSDTACGKQICGVLDIRYPRLRTRVVHRWIPWDLRRGEYQLILTVILTGVTFVFDKYVGDRLSDQAESSLGERWKKMAHRPTTGSKSCFRQRGRSGVTLKQWFGWR